MHRYLIDAALMLDEATASGRTALEFEDMDEARKHVFRLNSILSRKRTHLDGLYKGLQIRRTRALVEVIDVTHPDADQWMPKVKEPD